MGSVTKPSDEMCVTAVGKQHTRFSSNLTELVVSDIIVTEILQHPPNDSHKYFAYVSLGAF